MIRRDRAVVEQRRDREDQGSRRQDPERDALDVAPRVAERDIASQQRVDDAVSWVVPNAGSSQCSVPPKSTSPTRSRRARWARASPAAARTAASSVPPAWSRASSNVSRSSTTSLECSGWRSFTCGEPRRAVARQLICRTRSPTWKGRMSANSMPSPRARATCVPRNGWVRKGATSSRSRCSRGNARRSTRRPSRPSQVVTPSGSRARTHQRADASARPTGVAARRMRTGPPPRPPSGPPRAPRWLEGQVPASRWCQLDPRRGGPVGFEPAPSRRPPPPRAGASGRARSRRTDAARWARISPAPAKTKNGALSSASSGRPLRQRRDQPGSPPARAGRAFEGRASRSKPLEHLQHRPQLLRRNPRTRACPRGTDGPVGRCPTDDPRAALGRARRASARGSGRARRGGARRSRRAAGADRREPEPRSLAGRDHQTLERDQLIRPRRRGRRPPAAPSRARVGQERHARGDRDARQHDQTDLRSSLTPPLPARSRPCSERNADSAASRKSLGNRVRAVARLLEQPGQRPRLALGGPARHAAPAAGTRAAPPPASGRRRVRRASRCIAPYAAITARRGSASPSSAPIAASTAARAALALRRLRRESLSPKPAARSRPPTHGTPHDREQRPRKPGRDREPASRAWRAGWRQRGARARTPDDLATELGRGVRRSGPGHRGGDQRRAHARTATRSPRPSRSRAPRFASARGSGGSPLRRRPGQSDHHQRPEHHDPGADQHHEQRGGGRLGGRARRPASHPRAARAPPSPTTTTATTSPSRRGRRPCPCARSLHPENALPVQSCRSAKVRPQKPSAPAGAVNGELHRHVQHTVERRRILASPLPATDAQARSRARLRRRAMRLAPVAVLRPLMASTQLFFYRWRSRAAWDCSRSGRAAVPTTSPIRQPAAPEHGASDMTADGPPRPQVSGRPRRPPARLLAGLGRQRAAAPPRPARRRLRGRVPVPHLQGVSVGPARTRSSSSTSTRRSAARTSCAA